MNFDEREARFVTRMIELRTENGWSQNEFARRLQEAGLNWKQPTVARVEEGSRPLRFTEALIIANFFNRTIDSMARAKQFTKYEVIVRLAAEALLGEQLLMHYYKTGDMEDTILDVYGEDVREKLPRHVQEWLNWIGTAPAGQPANLIWEQSVDLYEAAMAEALQIPDRSIHSISLKKDRRGSR